MKANGGRLLLVAAHGTPDRVLRAVRRQCRLYERLGVCARREDEPGFGPRDWGPEARRWFRQ